MKFSTKFERIIDQGEKNSGEIKVDKFDYVPPQVQIGRMIQAGERLKMARREAYDFGFDEEVPDEYEDVTRRSDFDLADVTQIKQMWDAKKAEMDEKAKQEKVQETPEDSPEV